MTKLATKAPYLSAMRKEAAEAPPYVPDDVVAGVLSFLKVNLITGNAEPIHRTLSRLRANHAVLQDFTFSSTTRYPFSRLLEEVLTRLQLARVIGMDNPDYDRYRINTSAKKIIQDEVVKRRFTEDERRQLEEIAGELEKECGIEE